MAIPSSHSVLEFKHIQFLGDWLRFSAVSAIQYTAVKKNTLLVVIEEPTGSLVTYRFTLDRDQEVWVVEDVVHIPAQCVKSTPGDKTTCAG
jgi:hypothetical protein